MITLRNLTLRRGTNVLLKNVSWTIYHKQRIGVIGANGTGKSSLFALLLNTLRNETHAELQIDQGDLEIPRQLRMAHLQQETPAYEKSALDYVLDGDLELRSLEQQLQIAEQEDDGHQIAHLHEQLSNIDGYSAPARAAQLLDGLGFHPAEQQQSVASFSGGWRVRLNLAQALMCRSDVLLLDEPTNHLDLDAVIWLEEWLANYPGTLLLISHDREFLDHAVDHIAHISQQQLKLYTGNYSSFEKQRATQILLQQSAYEKQQKQIAHMQSFVNRFRAKATKARQAQSRMKAIERLELVNAVQLDSPFHFEFKSPEQCPNPLVYLENAAIAYGEKTILSHLNLSIGPRDRIAMLGPNGAGKSSLIKLLAGDLEPSHGKREVSSGVKIGYFAQHQVDHLNLSETPLYHLRQLAPQTSEVELRTYLGSFGFIGNDVLALVKHFSGGEKSRLALALLVWQRPNLLLLDEPTNHLDLEMRHALSIGLQNYEGAMILVSHDRFLTRTTVDQLMLAAHGELTDFTGDLNDYEKWLANFRRAESQPKEITTPKKKVARAPSLQQIQKLEIQMDKLTKELTQVEEKLADNTLYTHSNQDKLSPLLSSQEKIKQELQQVEENWLTACEQRDQLS